MEINKILWASDGSPESNEALKYVELLAKKYDSQVIGLSVIEKFNLDRIQIPLHIRKELLIIQSENEKTEFERIRNSLNHIGVEEKKLTTRIEVNEPYEEILRVAKEQNVDLIVMGKRGLGLKDRILLGSNTNKVLRAAEVPVLAVKHKEGRKTDIKKILVPTDLSELTTSSVKYAIDLASRFDSTLLLVNVLELHHTYEMAPVSVIDAIANHALAELQNCREKIIKETKLINVNERVAFSVAAWLGIINIAEKEDVDLIVITTHGRKGISKFILGSVAEKVINESHCPVLALKP